MLYKLHKSGVLTGSLNCYCLACDTFLTTHQEADQHLGTSPHQKSLLAIPYLDKFKEEHIRKFQTGYYCEFCNIMLPTASKVNLHLTEDEHVTNKGLCLLLPRGGGVVAFDNIFIEENAWHSLIDGVCSICNEEFDEGEEHKASARHSLNIVLKEIRFGTGNAIYRQIDDTSLQCVTCNKLLVPDKLTAHFDDAQHRELYNKCRILTNGIDHETEAKAIKEEHQTAGGSPTIEFKSGLKQSNIDANKSAESKTKILESLTKYQSAGININLERETAYCKKCSEVVEFNYANIEKHITDHSTNAPVDTTLQYPSNPDQNLNRVDINDKTAQRSEINDEIESKIKALQENSNEKVKSDEDGDSSNEIVENEKEFAKINKITYNQNNKQSYCRVCKVHLPANLKSMKEHVGGANHKKLADSSPTSKCQIQSPTMLIKKRTGDFIDSLYDVNSLFDSLSIINEEYCVTKNSLVFLTAINSRMRCLLCEVTLPPFSDTDDHIKTRRHITKFLEVPVIVSVENEFIREMHPGLYHCAYCELVITGWADMEKHLKCSDHHDNRRKGEQRLISRLPGLQNYKLEKAIEAMAIRRLFNMF
ncbi:uncharacterized protein LOC111357314 [Spodoptera litura]|uniref:Uncharacterized protein LOC111357314 n=1 Tax=Spodoptera litura TaxID=69820 RepID=A0A9J7IVZ7_SPOLT|nr:uncharacterized protein LOC111357314 [Spodoptera litura]